MVIKIQKSQDVKQKLRQLEIALVIDNTGSMAGEIARVQGGLTELVNRIITHEMKPQASFAVIGYRDHPPQDSTFVSQVFCGLDGEMKRVAQALNLMRAQGGGDGPEAVIDGLHSALSLGWNQIAQKAILLVGDAPPHGEGAPGDSFVGGCPCGWDMRQVTGRMNSAGIVGHAVGVRKDTTMMRTFAAFAKSTGGVFVHLDRLNDLIPILLKRIDEEMGKIAADIRTLEKLEHGGTVTDADRESIERLAKKGVRVMTVAAPPAAPEEKPTTRRIRILS